jgi:hypothetical protein
MEHIDLVQLKAEMYEAARLIDPALRVPNGRKHFRDCFTTYKNKIYFWYVNSTDSTALIVRELPSHIKGEEV